MMRKNATQKYTTIKKRAIRKLKVTALELENKRLKAELKEVKETLQAIRNGEIDAIVVNAPQGDRVYALKTIDHPYRILVETISEGTAIFTEYKMITYANGSFAKLVEEQLEKVIGGSIDRYFQGKEKEHFNMLIQEEIRNGDVWESIIQTATGKLCPVLLSMNRIRLDDENAFCLIATDLTSQKEDEARSRLLAQLQESQERFKSVLENSLDCIYRLNLQTGQFEYISPAAEKIIGYSPAELMSQDAERTITSLVHPDDRETIQTASAQLDQTHDVEVEYRQQDKSGSYHWISDHMSLTRDSNDRPLYRNGSIREISERKRAENELRRNEEFLSFSLSSAKMGAWELNLNDHTAHRSLLHDQIFGYQRLLPKWTYEMFLEHIYPEDRENVKQLFQKAIETRTNLNFECRITRTDQVIRWIWTAGRLRFGTNENSERMIGIIQDITDRKQVEQAVRSSEQLLRTVIDNSRDGISMIDLQSGRYVLTSPAQVELAGFSPEEMGKLNSDDVLARVHPDDQEYLLSQQKKILAGEDLNAPVEYRWRMKSGEYRYFSESRNLIRNEQGHSVALVAVTRDITDQKRDVAALKTREAQLRILIDNLASGVVLTDGNGNITLYNQHFLSMFDIGTELKLENLHDQAWNLWQFFDSNGKLLNAEDQPMRRAIRTCQPVRGQLLGMLAPFKTDLVWMLVSAVPLFADNATLENLICTFHEITTLRQTEEALKESEERFRVAQELSPDGFTILKPVRDSEGHVFDFIWVYENDAIARMNGTDPKEVIGHRLLDVLPGYEQTSFFKIYQHVAETGKTQVLGSVNYGKMNQNPTWCRVVVVPSGQDIAVLAQDITERKNAEEQLEEALKVRDEFMSIASHELKTPLTTIQLQIQNQQRMVQKAGGGALPVERLNKSSELISRQLVRLTTLVNDLLDVSRISAGRLTLNREIVNLSDLLHDVIERERQGLISANMSLTIDIQEGIEINADKLRIEQVFGNLISNAIKYAPGKPLCITLKENNNCARIEVQDHGEGVGKENQLRIFERYERVVTKPTGVSGLGLGLYISKQISKAHGGDIWVDCEAGVGSCFIVEIPIVNRDNNERCVKI